MNSVSSLLEAFPQPGTKPINQQIVDIRIWQSVNNFYSQIGAPLGKVTLLKCEKIVILLNNTTLIRLFYLQNII